MQQASRRKNRGLHYFEIKKMNIKVVFHIDEKDKWQLLTGNVSNLCRGVPLEEREIEILANSLALELFREKDSPFIPGLEDLHRSGVRICVCRNSLRGMGIGEEEIPRFMEVVPIGVKELAERQIEGFAYIKP